MAWRGTESDAPTPFATERLPAAREAASESLGRTVTWDGLAEVQGDARESGPLADALTGGGCLLLSVAYVGIWVYGLVSLFD
ncbi:DUF6584 family protein [Streptomyces sp. CB00316]|uniref:DUF6584 family protein n=1 Tax=unclassified Streptomyces TaxID=2593676 RepID=UPI001F440DA9|nr:DUF6584 family protein [Streptomyces sp. CB00316]